MSCVNRNTEEFKELVNSTGIHPDNIESIVYTLQSRSTDPNYYPTASEVREALRPKPIILDESTSKWFLSKGYSNFMVFKSSTEMWERINELEPYFAPSQFSTYKKASGDYVVELNVVNKDNTIKFYTGDITPDSNTIFVFGSNPKGIHGAGAAKTAKEHFGAQYGVGEGITGSAYALPTKDLDKAKGTRWYRPTEKEAQEVKEWYKSHDYSEVVNHLLNSERTITPQQIIESIKRLYETARNNPDKQFKVSNYPLNSLSRNGYLGYEMLEMFKAAGVIPSNIVFSKEWVDTGKFNTQDARIEQDKDTTIDTKIKWAVTSKNGFEVSTKAKEPGVIGDTRFSAFNAKFKSGTVVDGVDVGGKSIEYVYQNIIKKSGKGQPPAKGSRLYNEALKTKEERENFSYYEAYLPLWQEWAKQNPKLIEELRKTLGNRELTDGFARKTTVNQARALADILNFSRAVADSNISKDKDTTKEPQVESVATKFTVSNSNSYPARTRENIILSDVTIALAQDFATAGEKLTKKEALEENKYIKANLSANTNNATEIANNIYEQLKTKGKLTNLKINIAGNGIYSMSQSQSYYNDLVTQVLKELQARGVTIAEIRSGGQTGIDEAGIIAAQRLGIPNEVHTTSDFKFRDKNNIDIADEKLFKERFSISDLEAIDTSTPTTDEVISIDENSTNPDKAFVDKSTEVTQQIDNLNSSSLLTASEVRHIARQIVWSISDHITDLMEKPGYAEQIYGERLKDKDLSKMSRAEVAKLIGADNLIARAKELFHPEKASYEDFDTMDKAEEIYNNWNALMLLASSEFLNTEKFSITSIDNNVYEVNEDLNADADNVNTSQKEMDVLESEGSLQEHWQIETKTLDVLDTMSQKVRYALMGCYILDKEGNPVTSEFGIKERIDVREATNSILRWGQGAFSLSQLINKLKEKEKSQPWVKQIIERLSDNSGRESDLKSQFWGTFCKHFQPYSIVTVDKKTGKYKSMIVNENPALKEAINQVITEYNIGEHPLFTSEGINSKSFEDLKEAFQELWKFNTKDTDFSSKDTIEEISNTLGYISNLFGYYVTPQMVENIIDENTFKKMCSALNYIMKSLEQNLNNKTYDPFKFDAKEGVKGNIMQFLKPITDQLEDISVAAFYDSGKMYQSYITPSYTTKLFKKFGLEGKEFDDFITEEYGNFDWFHTGTNIERGWRNVWLQTLVLNENARKVFKHKVQLNFNKSNYMKTMDDVEYTISLITEYLSGETINKRTAAWFRVPMLSNKPSSEFIRFYSERGDNYKKVLTDGFKKIFDQELSRIQTVEMRNLGKKDPGFIKSFDTNGRKFCFLDFMNEYLNGSKKSSELGQLIRQKLNGEKINEARLNELALETIKNSIQSRVNGIISNWEKQGIINGLKKVQGIGATKEEIRNTLENFIWNDTFAAMNIMQLTITDIAYYKDAEDLQKRLAQIHAPGIRGDIYAKDYGGKNRDPERVSDGFYRTIKLADFKDVLSNIIDNVSIVLDRKIEAAKTEEEKKGLRALKESLVGKEGAFRKINVADAQGYSSPTSYRKKAFMFGKWSKEAEEVYKKLREGTYNYRDLQVAFQPLKPFVYSQIVKNSNAEKAPLSTLKVPIQFKNSEYLLIMADALLQGENTGKPNLLRAIFKTMERSHFNDKDEYKADGIDTIQFESTTKSGLSGAISLNDLVNDPNGEAIALARLNAAMYKEDGSYNENTVDVVPMEDYCLQQEIPEHFKEHEQMHGSQLRYIIPSELEGSEGITYKTEKGEVSAQEFKEEYERTIAENIEEDLANLENKLALNSFSIRDRNIALSKVLQREILSSPRYGIDLLQACSIDENGNFRIPLGDPIQSKRVEQLINSIIKNSVNKQEIPGGPVVQVSNFGTSKELNIRFKNKNKEGELLDLRKDYKGTDEEYKNYIKENQEGIAYFEVFAPIYTNNLFTKFADKNGIINIKAIEMLEPDLLKMIGYRIPTEDKYSMAPLKIVGFLPREAGDGIMLPNDITLLTGSDYDIDKEYLMRKDYKIKQKKISRSKIHQMIFNDIIESSSKDVKYGTKRELNELIDSFLDDPFDSHSLVNQKTAKGYMTMTKKAYNRMLRTYVENMYEVSKPTEGRAYRNNKIVDMTYEVLTHETSVDKMLNPGGFDDIKKMGYMVEASKNTSIYWDKLEELSIEELKDLSNGSKNLSYIDTHIQFYKQNSAAGSLIGIFAVNRIAHAVLESGSIDGSSEYYIDTDRIKDFGSELNIAGFTINGLMPLDSRYDRKGRLIGKILGSFVASSVDAVKDPILNLMNINNKTANILNCLIRIGMPFEDACLFLSQSVVSTILAEHSRENINGKISLNKVIEKRLKKIEGKTGLNKNSQVDSEEITREELISGIRENSDLKATYKILRALEKLTKLAEAVRMPTFATRFNSISSAVGPLIVDNLMTEYSIENLSNKSSIVNSEGKRIQMVDILDKHPILKRFSETYSKARELFKDMPAGSYGFKGVLNNLEGTYLSNVLYSDRRLLSKFSDFYQSYLAMKGNVVNPKDLSYYIGKFPKEFINRGYKEKYKENQFIQAIRIDTDKSGRAILRINTTGLDTSQKETLGSAWVDLHKKDPELSMKLFKYSFFRGGMGFSPKTFMSILPVYVKEKIPNYVETFRSLPSVVPEVVIDQFIRNNWEDNKLVPRKNVTLKHLEEHQVEVSAKKDDVNDLRNVIYFKTKGIEGTGVLYRQVAAAEDFLIYEEVSKLGDRKEYLEINEDLIEKPTEISSKEEEKNILDQEEIDTQDEFERKIEEETSEDKEEITEDDVESLTSLLYDIVMAEGRRTKEQSSEWIKAFRAKTTKEKEALFNSLSTFFKNRLTKMGVTFNEDLIKQLYKLMC